MKKCQSNNNSLSFLTIKKISTIISNNFDYKKYLFNHLILFGMEYVYVDILTYSSPIYNVIFCVCETHTHTTRDTDVARGHVSNIFK